MLPHIILHNVVSLDGRNAGFEADLGLFYGLIGEWREDATLAGCDTLLAADAEEEVSEGSQEAQEPAGDTARPLLVVPDSRGRLHNWRYWRNQPYWRDILILCSQATPANFIADLEDQKIDHIVAGADHVDLRQALEELNRRYGVRVVRVDSGGTLNGRLLRAGLVNEISLLIHPVLIGGAGHGSIFKDPSPALSGDPIQLQLIHQEKLKGSFIWLRYQVIQREKSDRLS